MNKISKRKANNAPCTKKDAKSIKRSSKNIDALSFLLMILIYLS